MEEEEESNLMINRHLGKSCNEENKQYFVGSINGNSEKEPKHA
jgi:hypothetical protein